MESRDQQLLSVKTAGAEIVFSSTECFFVLNERRRNGSGKPEESKKNC